MVRGWARKWTAIAGAVIGWLWLLQIAGGRAAAHEGPPFPIAMDERLADVVVSVWADPDIGEARFFVVVESPAGGPPQGVTHVSMWVEPANGRLERVHYAATRQPQRNQLQFLIRPTFDQRDMWNIGFELTNKYGDTVQMTRQIESTPPGFGLWDFAIYLFPFLFLAGMWVLAMLRRGRYAPTEPAGVTTVQGTNSDVHQEAKDPA